MQILSLQPYYGGSHKYCMEAVKEKSRHNWEVFTLPANKWKWRMQHAAITFAEELSALPASHPARKSEVIFCSDMLNLAEFRGLAPRWAGHLPAVFYFHENQFAYPGQNKQQEKENAGFGFINMLSGCAADQVWFNSCHNRDSFFSGLRAYLKSCPNNRPWEAYQRLKEKSRVVYPGIHQPLNSSLTERRAGEPLRIAWAARWEHDKGPELFFNSLKLLQQRGIRFKLRVLGEQFKRHPEIFDTAADWFKDEIEVWGFEPAWERYMQWLASSDVIVSTAKHEFFGIAILEGAASGAYPVLPQGLSYPELFGDCEKVFYDGSMEGLADKLTDITETIDSEKSTWQCRRRQTADIARSFDWQKRVAEIDKRMAEMVLSK